MSNREQIVEVRRATNIPPKRQFKTKLNTFYVDPEKQKEDALELAYYIAEARAERLAREEYV